ncbi:MAG: ASCH domain-containing protein [Luminiphilus sp.]
MARHILISDGPAQPNPADIDAFWERACEQHLDLGGDYQVRSLGIDAETTTQILEYIKTRDKVATFSLPWVIEANGFPHPEPGTPIVLCDYVGQPHLIVRLTDVRETTFGEIGYAESSLDGPPVKDPDVWIPLHRQYWNGLLAAYGRECTDDMPVLIEPFDYISEVY